MQANEVTKELGINRDRIKYFRKQEVFEPENPAVGNRSPEYTQEDVEKLRLLVILTKAGLSCGDIRKIQTGEWTMEQALSIRRGMIQTELERMKGSLELLSEMLEKNTDYEQLDTGYYWDVISRKEQDGTAFIDVETLYGAEQAEQMADMKQLQMQTYVDEGLIHPVKAAKDHAAKNTFTENEIAQMRAVAVLRQYLGIQEIKRFQAYPEQTDELLLELSERNGTDLRENVDVVSSIRKLQALVRDAADLEQIRKETRQSPISKIAAGAVLVVILVVLGWDIITAVIYEPRLRSVILLTLTIVVAMISTFMTLRYATAVSRGKHARHHGTGTVLRIKEEAGFSASYVRVGNQASGVSEPGRGGSWVFFFLFWYMLRPDRWYPTIRFQDEKGVQAMSTFCYGGMKKDWTEGEIVEIAWNDYRKNGLLPCGGTWMRRKAALYGILSAILIVLIVIQACVLA